MIAGKKMETTIGLRVKVSGCVVGVWNSGFGFGSRVVGPGRILLMFLGNRRC